MFAALKHVIFKPEMAVTTNINLLRATIPITSAAPIKPETSTDDSDQVYMCTVKTIFSQ
jgi:hypothetical protein